MQSATPSPYAVVLEVCDGVAPASRLSLEGKVLAIGRSPDNAIHLDRATVSRRHAQIYCDPFHRWFVKDLGSRNGTRVNGHLEREQSIQAGDSIGIGEFSLRVVQLGGHEPSPEPMVEPTTKSLAVTDTHSHISTLRDIEPPRVAASHLSMLNELGQRLLAVAEPAERMRELCRMVVRPEFHGRCATVLRLSREKSVTEPRVLCPPEFNPESRNDAPYISRSVMRSLLESGTPLLASNAAPSAFNAQISISPDVQAIAAIACPLRSDGAGLDVLYLLLPPQYGTGEWLALATMASKQYEQAEAAWSARRREVEHATLERELLKARDIQLRLLPPELSLPGLEVAVGFKPCRWVGGDYPDVVPARDGRVLLVIADVCGKGLPAALITQSLHAITRMCMRAGMPLPEMMRSLADYLRHPCSHTSFVTLCAVLLDPATGELECINAGHPPALVLSAGGEARCLQSAQHMPLGVEEGDFDLQRDRIGPGEVLALYTDGLIDLVRPDGESLGTEGLHARLRQLPAEAAGATARALAQRLTEFLDAFQGDAMPADDRTFLLARRA